MTAPATPPTIYPVVRYRDVSAGIKWLTDVVGFSEAFIARDDSGAIVHAQLAWGPGVVMAGPAGESGDGGATQPPGHSWLYLAAEDIDELYEKVQAAGAEVVRTIRDEDYGSREFGLRDPEGNLWSFGTYHPTAEGGH